MKKDKLFKVTSSDRTEIILVTDCHSGGHRRCLQCIAAAQVQSVVATWEWGPTAYFQEKPEIWNLNFSFEISLRFLSMYNELNMYMYIDIDIRGMCLIQRLHCHLGYVYPLLQCLSSVCGSVQALVPR